MATSWYRHPDLFVRLNNPNEARIFIDDPRTWLPNKKPRTIELWDCTELNISDTQRLSDQLVIEAAFVILDDLIERTLLEAPPMKYDH